MGTYTEEDFEELLGTEGAGKEKSLAKPEGGADPDKGAADAGAEDKDVPEEFRGMSKGQLAAMLKQQGGMLSELINRTGQPPARVEAEPEPDKPAFEADDLVDPKRLEDKVLALFMRKAAPLVAQQQTSAALTAYNHAKQSLPHFDRFEKQIIETLRTQGVHPSALGNPVTWQMAHSMVLAQNMDMLVDEKVKERDKKPVRTPGHSERPAGDNAGVDLALSVEEKSYARKLGVSEKEYAQYKKLMGY